MKPEKLCNCDACETRNGVALAIYEDIAKLADQWAGELAGEGNPASELLGAFAKAIRDRAVAKVLITGTSSE